MKLHFFAQKLLLGLKKVYNSQKDIYKNLAPSSKNYSLYFLGYLGKHIFFLTSIFLLAFPFIFLEKTSNETVSNKDIIYIVDVSESMGAKDSTSSQYSKDDPASSLLPKNVSNSSEEATPESSTRISRLQSAKDFISTFAEKNPNNRFAIIGFERDAKTIFPLGNDLQNLYQSNASLEPRMLTKHGSDIAAGIRQAKNSIQWAKSPIVVIFSDSAEIVSSIDTSILQNIPVFIVGIGTEKWSKIQKGSDFFGNPLYRKYQNEDVIVKLETAQLQDLANSLDGKYYTFSDFSKSFISKISDQTTKPNSLFFLFSALAFLLGILTPDKKLWKK